MLVRNFKEKELIYRTRGNKIVINPRTVTYIEDGLVTEKELKDAYGYRIQVIKDNEVLPVFPVKVKEKEQEAKMDKDLEDILNEVQNELGKVECSNEDDVQEQDNKIVNEEDMGSPEQDNKIVNEEDMGSPEQDNEIVNEANIQEEDKNEDTNVVEAQDNSQETKVASLVKEKKTSKKGRKSSRK